MINDFLPQHLEAFNCNDKYQILRSILIDGHEVAWTEITLFNSKPSSYRSLICECDFKFKIDDSGVPCRMFDFKDHCIYRGLAMQLRRLELHQEYLGRFKSVWGMVDWSKYIEEILFDLIDKAKNGEFIGEDSPAASLYGGYFYLKTFLNIVGWHGSERSFIDHCMTSLSGKISFNGSVICDYFEP